MKPYAPRMLEFPRIFPKGILKLVGPVDGHRRAAAILATTWRVVSCFNRHHCTIPWHF